MVVVSGVRTLPLRLLTDNHDLPKRDAIQYPLLHVDVGDGIALGVRI